MILAVVVAVVIDVLAAIFDLHAEETGVIDVVHNILDIEALTFPILLRGDFEDVLKVSGALVIIKIPKLIHKIYYNII